jgi:ubiquinone/menaquinone biosynthesis C-methylase UbiE
MPRPSQAPGRKRPALKDSFACPDCRAPLAAGLLRCAACGARFKREAGFAMLLPSDLGADLRQSIAAWNKEWALLKGDVLEGRRLEYERDYLQDTLDQLLAWVDPKKHRRFMEIGCGPGFLGVALSRRGFETAGLDVCIEALKVAKKVHAGLKRPSFFFGGELNHIPLREGSVDFLYGGGVIEHFKDTAGCVRELHRVLAPGGVSFNTVPYFSVGSLTYRQIWGNIPNVPLLRQLAEAVHLGLLKGRHMTYGYEMSFTASTLKRIHLQAGFSRVEVRRFEVFLPLNFMPAPLKGMARVLTRWRPFWPMVAVVAVK